MFKFPSSGGSRSVNASAPTTTIATTTPKLGGLRQYREDIRESSRGEKEYDKIPTISSPYSSLATTSASSFTTERQLSTMATPPHILPSSSSSLSAPITADAIATALFKQMNDKKAYTENWINSIEDSRRKEEKERSSPLSSTSVSHLAKKTSLPPTMNYVVSNNTNVVCSKKSSIIDNEENDRDSHSEDNDNKEEEEEEENNDQLLRGRKKINDPTVDAINVAANVVNDIASAALNLENNQPVRGDNYYYDRSRARGTSPSRRMKGRVSRFASSAYHLRRTPYDQRRRVRRSRSRGRNNETRTSMSPPSLKKMTTTNGAAKRQNSRFFDGMVGRLYRAVRLPVYLSSNVLLAYYVLNSLGVDPFSIVTEYANINFKNTVFNVAINGVASFVGRSGSFLTSVIYNRWKSVVASFINDSSKDGGGDTTKISSSSSPSLSNIDDLIWQSYMKKAIGEPSKMLMMNTAPHDVGGSDGGGCSNGGLINIIAQRMENENLKSFIDPLSELISSPTRDERAAAVTTPFSSTAATASASSSSLIISEALNRILLKKKNENATAPE